MWDFFFKISTVIEINKACTHVEIVHMIDKGAVRGRVINLLSNFLV